MAGNNFALLDQIGIPYLTVDGQAAHGSFADQLAKDEPAAMVEPIAIPCPWDYYLQGGTGAHPIDTPSTLRYVITSLRRCEGTFLVGYWWSFDPQSVGDSVTLEIKRYVFNPGTGTTTITTVHTKTFGGGVPEVGHWWVDDTTWAGMYDGSTYTSQYISWTGTAGRLTVKRLHCPQGVLVRVSGSDTDPLPTPRVPQVWANVYSPYLTMTGYRQMAQRPAGFLGHLSGPGLVGMGWPFKYTNQLCGEVITSPNSTAASHGVGAYPPPKYSPIPQWHLDRLAGAEAATFPRVWDGSTFQDYVGFTDCLGPPVVGCWVYAGTIAPPSIGAARVTVSGIPAYDYVASSASYTVTDTATSTVLATGTLYYDGNPLGANPGLVVNHALATPADGAQQRLRLDLTQLGPGSPITGTLYTFPTFAPPPFAAACADGTVLLGRQVTGWKLPVQAASLTADIEDAAPGATTATGLAATTRRCRFTPPAGWWASTYGVRGEAELSPISDSNPTGYGLAPSRGGGAPFYANTGGLTTCTLTAAAISRPDLTVGAPVSGSLFRRFVAPATGQYLFTFYAANHDHRWRAFLSTTDPNVIAFNSSADYRARVRRTVNGLLTAPPAAGWWGLRTYAIQEGATGEWTGRGGQYASCYGMGSTYEWAYENSSDGDLLVIVGGSTVPAYQRRDGVWETTTERLDLSAAIQGGAAVYVRMGIIDAFDLRPVIEPLGESSIYGAVFIGVTAA